MSDITTLSAKFQISIPKALRIARRWRAGQKFAFIPNGTGVMLVPVPDIHPQGPRLTPGKRQGRKRLATASQPSAEEPVGPSSLVKRH